MCFKTLTFPAWRRQVQLLCLDIVKDPTIDWMYKIICPDKSVNEHTPVGLKTSFQTTPSMKRTEHCKAVYEILAAKKRQHIWSGLPWRSSCNKQLTPRRHQQQQRHICNLHMFKTRYVISRLWPINAASKDCSVQSVFTSFICHRTYTRCPRNFR